MQLMKRLNARHSHNVFSLAWDIAVRSVLIPAVVVVGLVLSATSALAAIEIEVTQGGEDAIPIAIVPFGWQGTGGLPEDIALIVASDLRRSGDFAPLAREDLVATPDSIAEVRYANWQLSGADYLVIGSVSQDGENYIVQAQLVDVVQQKLLSGVRFLVTAQSLRNAAHQIADEVYEKVLGVKGAFNTQIAYVSMTGPQQNRTYRLELADADGQSAQPMLTSPRPIMSPAWAPDGVRIAYVSFENRQSSAIYIQDRIQGTRTKLVSREGINGAPAWSPDGTRLAVVLSYNGSADIYIIEVATGRTQRITDSDAIDTEPAWIDNETLVFTSDRSGGAQLYEVPARGGSARRLTFEGSYNANAAVSPDGTEIAFVHRSDRGYQIAVIDRNSGLFRTLTNGTLDESPSFAPNGQMILFATERNGRGVLGAVSIDGDLEQTLSQTSASVREPAWSPFSR